MWGGGCLGEFVEMSNGSYERATRLWFLVRHHSLGVYNKLLESNQQGQTQSRQLYLMTPKEQKFPAAALFKFKAKVKKYPPKKVSKIKVFVKSWQE